MIHSRATKTITAIAGIGVILSAWIILVSNAGAENSDTAGEQPTITQGAFGQDIHLINLEDGTRCAVISGARSAGIDCDWHSDEGAIKQ